MRYFSYLFLVLILASSCSAQDDFDVAETPVWVQPQDSVTSEFHILVIGNSLSRDAFSYVPSIMSDACPEVSVEITVLYISGKPLSTHWNYISNRKQYITDVFSVETNSWTTTSGNIADDIFLSKRWDLIVFQEGSANARNLSSTKPYVDRISDYIRDILPNCKFAYTIIPSLADGYSALGSRTSNDVWQMNVAVAKELLDKGDVGYLIPCGTGIQNARHTYLDALGNFGHLSYDGRHLQEGIPCLIDAYSAAQSFFNILNIDASIYNSSMSVTQKWVKLINVPGRHGAVIEGSVSDYDLCKQCAMFAVDSPYSIFGEEIK